MNFTKLLFLEESSTAKLWRESNKKQCLLSPVFHALVFNSLPGFYLSTLAVQLKGAVSCVFSTIVITKSTISTPYQTKMDVNETNNQGGKTKHLRDPHILTFGDSAIF